MSSEEIKRKNVARELLSIKINHQISIQGLKSFIVSTNKECLSLNIPFIYPKSYYLLLQDAKLIDLPESIGFLCYHLNCNQFNLIDKSESACTSCKRKIEMKNVIKRDHFFIFNLEQVLNLLISYKGYKISNFYLFIFIWF